MSKIGHLEKLSIVMLSALSVVTLADTTPASKYDPKPISASRYEEPDALFKQLSDNLNSAPGLTQALDIAHSRRAAAVHNYMPPSHVLMFSNGNLFESALISEHRLAALDLPLRVLAYETVNAHFINDIALNKPLTT